MLSLLMARITLLVEESVFEHSTFLFADRDTDEAVALDNWLAVSLDNWFWMFEETQCLQNGGNHPGTDQASHSTRPKSSAMSLRELPSPR
jgi:hypothetical protein